MRLDNTVDIFEVVRVSDGRGGFKKLEQYKYSIDCKVKQTRLNKQEQLYGEVSKGAISIITLEELDERYIIAYKDKKYSITNSVEAFRKYAYDLLEITND